MIEVKGLTKTFKDKKRGEVLAVDEVEFEVQPGEIFGLLGPNGAGKTTTLRMLSTVLRPTAGTAVIDGIDIGKEPGEVRKRIGFLSGDMGLYHRLTPRELVRFFARLYGMDGAELEERINSLIDRFEMKEFADTKIATLSTGMKQKTALARTLAPNPPVIILDEPTSGLDVPTARVVEDFILETKKEGKAILYSTHIMEEAEYICDRIGVIHKGEIRAVGTMDELREKTGKKALREIFLDLLGIELKDKDKDEGEEEEKDNDE